MIELIRKLFSWPDPKPTHPFGIDPNQVVNKFEYWYLCTLKELLSGRPKDDRTGTGTISTTSMTYTHDLRDGFPVIRSRWLKPENPPREMVWMMSGSKNVNDLKAMGVPFWDSFADETGDLGPIYGYLWRHWPNPKGGEDDQLQYIRDTLADNPSSRRMVCTSWHPSFIPDPTRKPKDNYKYGHSALTACHYAWQVLTQMMNYEERKQYFKEHYPQLYYTCSLHDRILTGGLTSVMDAYRVPVRFLDLQFVMRSNDFVLGNPANFGMYAYLAHRLAAENNMVARHLCYTGMDVHVYANHVDGVEQQLLYAAQNPEEVFMRRSDLTIKTPGGSYNWDEISVGNYDRRDVGPYIKFPIAV